MSIGLFDLPVPLLDAIDAGLAALQLPTVLRILLYAIAFGILGMLVYKRFSSQSRLADVRKQVNATQRELATYDGDFAGLRSLIRRNMTLALRLVSLTFWPALIASVPLLFVLPWLSNRFSEIAPPTGSTVVACSEPAAVARALEWRPAAVAEIAGEGCWKLRWPAPDASVEITDAAQVWLRLPLPALTPVVHKHGWLNVLFANPGGYLDDAAPFDALTLALAPREVIAFGPRWMRGWMFAFFVPLLLVSLVIKWRWRIH